MIRRGLTRGASLPCPAIGSIQTVGGTATVSQPVGTTVVAVGTGLGAGVPTVTVDGFQATVTAHTPDSVTFTLPGPAGTGDIRIVTASATGPWVYPRFTQT